LSVEQTGLLDATKPCAVGTVGFGTPVFPASCALAAARGNAARTAPTAAADTHLLNRAPGMPNERRRLRVKIPTPTAYELLSGSS
jgi:hypothetical protein